MSVSQILNQRSRQSETKLFWWFYFSRVNSTEGNRSASWFTLRDDLTCRRMRPSQHAMSGWTQFSYPFKCSRVKQHSERSDKDGGRSQSTSRELWGRFCTCITCWGTFGSKTKEAFDQICLHSCKHKIQSGHVVSAGFHSNPNYWFLPGRNTVARCLWLSLFLTSSMFVLWSNQTKGLVKHW